MLYRLNVNLFIIGLMARGMSTQILPGSGDRFDEKLEVTRAP